MALGKGQFGANRTSGAAVELESWGREDVSWCCWRCFSTICRQLILSVMVTLAAAVKGKLGKSRRYASPSTKIVGLRAARLLRRASPPG